MGPLAGKKIIEIAGLGPGMTNVGVLEMANAAIRSQGKKSIAVDLTDCEPAGTPRLRVGLSVVVNRTRRKNNLQRDYS